MGGGGGRVNTTTHYFISRGRRERGTSVPLGSPRDQRAPRPAAVRGMGKSGSARSPRRQHRGPPARRRRHHLGSTLRGRSRRRANARLQKNRNTRKQHKTSAGALRRPPSRRPTEVLRRLPGCHVAPSRVVASPSRVCCGYPAFATRSSRAARRTRVWGAAYTSDRVASCMYVQG